MHGADITQENLFLTVHLDELTNPIWQFVEIR